MNTLNQFTQVAALKAIGLVRVPMFLDGFNEELRAANIRLPAPLDSLYASASETDTYFDSMVTILASPALLPEPLRNSMLTIEETASPKNHDRLQEVIFNRLPCSSLTGYCPLDRALELWFSARDELSQFVPIEPAVSDPASSFANPETPSNGSLTYSLSHSPTRSLSGSSI